MDKKYTDFAAGSAASTQIILTADPGTGALGKIPLSSIVSGGGGSDTKLFQSNAEVIATIGNDFTFYSFSLAANTLSVDGDCLILEWWVKRRFPPSEIALESSVGAFNASTASLNGSGNLFGRALWIRTGANAGYCIMGSTSYVNNIQFGSTGSQAIDWTIVNTVKMKGSGTLSSAAESQFGMATLQKML